MAINPAEFSVAANGDIRHISGTTVYSTLDLHAWLQDLADNSSPSGDDAVSILSANPSKISGARATNKPISVTLLNGFNIDDTAAQYFNFGSIEQLNGNELYTGVQSIGSPLVAGSPVYVVQNAAKITSFWGNGHIQILVKARVGGALIDNGDIRAYSRKFGQTYADFAANLTAGSEQPVAISTSLDGNIVLTLSNALALSPGKVNIAVGDTSQNLGNGNGSKLYKGTITLTGGCTLAEAYQYCMAICSETSAVTINGVAGWQFRNLSNYTPNAAAPFGTLVGGKWFIAQGWWITGVLPAEAQKYQLIADDGTPQIPPNLVGITIGAVAVGDTVIVGRDTGTDINLNEYTLASARISTDTAVVVNAPIKSDTPSSGFIRIGGVRFAYNSWAGSTFTLAAALGQGFASGTAAFVPFIDKVATGTSESVSFIYSADFTARVKVRRGDTIQPFETTFAVGSAGGSTNAIRTLDI